MVQPAFMLALRRLAAKFTRHGGDVSRHKQAGEQHLQASSVRGVGRQE